MKAVSLLDELLVRGYEKFTGVPCSILKPFINCVIDSKRCQYIPATIEGEALAMSAGSYLAGIHQVVLLQNSGLGNIINPLTSLVELYRTPCLCFVTWRGEPGTKDAPQHGIMGEITKDLLRGINMPYAVLEDSMTDLKETVARADRSIKEERRSFAIVLRKGLFEPEDLKTRLRYVNHRPFEKMVMGDEPSGWQAFPSRKEVLEIISRQTIDCPVISTTGYTSREFYNEGDRESNFYMQGSMGFALPIALGLSMHYKGRVFCLDGDGALLMRMGGLFTAGAFNRGNLTYILLDNNCHDSTGGQTTISSWVKFDKLAEAAGFERLIQVNDTSGLRKAISLSNEGNSSVFIHVRTRPGKGVSTGRPEITPQEITDRFRMFIKKNL